MEVRICEYRNCDVVLTDQFMYCCQTCAYAEKNRRNTDRRRQQKIDEGLNICHFRNCSDTLKIGQRKFSSEYCRKQENSLRRRDKRRQEKFENRVLYCSYRKCKNPVPMDRDKYCCDYCMNAESRYRTQDRTLEKMKADIRWTKIRDGSSQAALLELGTRFEP